MSTPLFTSRKNQLSRGGRTDEHLWFSGLGRKERFAQKCIHVFSIFDYSYPKYSLHTPLAAGTRTNVQVQATGKKVGTATLKVTFTDTPGITAEAIVNVVQYRMVATQITSWNYWKLYNSCSRISDSPPALQDMDQEISKYLSPLPPPDFETKGGINTTFLADRSIMQKITPKKKSSAAGWNIHEFTVL